jgi:hypothetical protein
MRWPQAAALPLEKIKFNKEVLMAKMVESIRQKKNREKTEKTVKAVMSAMPGGKAASGKLSRLAGQAQHAAEASRLGLEPNFSAGEKRDRIRGALKTYLHNRSDNVVPGVTGGIRSVTG